jgi:hypothetical protein
VSKMDEMLEAAILGDANDDDIEEAILIMLNLKKTIYQFWQNCWDYQSKL